MAMAQSQSDFESWTACSNKVAEAVRNKRKYILPTTTGWTCTICERSIDSCPVYQCTKGHLSCSLCHKNGKGCTSCPTDEPCGIRNLAVETIIESMEVTCKFAPVGCKQTWTFCEFKEKGMRRSHEGSCKFKPMVCPMPGCSQAGVEHRLPEHLSTKHNISRLVELEDLSGDGCSLKYGGSFELKPSTSLVMLRMPTIRRDGNDPWEYFLLRQDSPTWGETLQITELDQDGFTSLKGYIKPTFKLEVRTTDKDATCMYTSTSEYTSNGMLMIPKLSVGEPFNFKVTLLDGIVDDKEDSEDDVEDFDDDK